MLQAEWNLDSLDELRLSFAVTSSPRLLAGFLLSR